MELTERVKMISFINFVRNSFDGADQVYSKGSCVHFACLLEMMFPGGVVIWDENHAVYRVGHLDYDINGVCDFKSAGVPLKDFDIYQIMRICESKAFIELI